MLNTIEPSYLWIPDRAGSYGDEIIDFGKQVGLAFDPEQELCIDALASYRRDGTWVASEAAIIEPRQNGKTMRVVLPMTMADLFLFPPDEMMHSAHRFITARKTFEMMKTLIDGCYEIRREVKRVVDSHGSESIELINGGLLMFLARSDIGGRGLGGKRVDFDEAFALQTGQLGAMMPTMLARPNSQVVYSSSAGMARSGPLREVRDRGREGNDPSLVYIEFCAPGDWEKPGCFSTNCNHHRSTPGCALDVVENWKKANPAIRAGRFTIEKIQMMRRSLSPLEFGREILGWWDIPAADDVVPISIEAWNRCKVEGSQIVGPISIAFDIAPDRKTSAISVAGHTISHAIQGELTRYAHGTDWVVPEIIKMREKHQIITAVIGGKRKQVIVCDPSGPAAALLPELQAVGIEPILMTAREMGAACGGLQDAVTAGNLAFVHIGQAQLDIAISGANRRDIGDGGWAFGRKRSAEVSVDICPLVSMTQARWGVTVAAKPVAMPRASWG